MSSICESSIKHTHKHIATSVSDLNAARASLKKKEIKLSARKASRSPGPAQSDRNVPSLALSRLMKGKQDASFS